jgi:uncharacterized protein YpuA (DUF1002 family)
MFYKREQIREIIKESPLKVLFSEKEIEDVVEDIFNRYGANTYQENLNQTGGELCIYMDSM